MSSWGGEIKSHRRTNQQVTADWKMENSGHNSTKYVPEFILFLNIQAYMF
jgi:hypothetical protein